MLQDPLRGPHLGQTDQSLHVQSRSLQILGGAGSEAPRGDPLPPVSPIPITSGGCPECVNEKKEIYEKASLRTRVKNPEVWRSSFFREMFPYHENVVEELALVPV